MKPNNVMDDTEYLIRATEYERMKEIAERFADQLDEIQIVLCSLATDTTKLARIRAIIEGEYNSESS